MTGSRSSQRFRCDLCGGTPLVGTGWTVLRGGLKACTTCRPKPNSDRRHERDRPQPLRPPPDRH